MAGVKAVAFGEHHPATWVEAWVDHPTAARGGGAGSPRTTDGMEEDVIQRITGQNARRY
jgi:hypothetical protein